MKTLLNNTYILIDQLLTTIENSVLKINDLVL
jgi:hypothetical protein